MNSEIKDILTEVKEGRMSVEDAVLEIRKAPFQDIGYAKPDMHRRLRQGAAEVIYGAGKTAEQIRGIVSVMLEQEQSPILITRVSPEAAEVSSAWDEVSPALDEASLSVPEQAAAEHTSSAERIAANSFFISVFSFLSYFERQHRIKPIAALPFRSQRSL